MAKTPFGDECYVQSYCTSKAEALRSLLNEIRDLGDAHATLDILRASLSTCRINHFLRTVPPRLTRVNSLLFENLMEQTFCSVTSCPFSRDLFAELQLPLKHAAKGEPTLGLGLTSAVRIPPAAYLGSIFDTTQIVCECLRSSSALIAASFPDAELARTEYNQKVAREDQLTEQYMQCQAHARRRNA